MSVIKLDYPHWEIWEEEEKKKTEQNKTKKIKVKIDDESF